MHQNSRRIPHFWFNALAISIWLGSFLIGLVLNSEIYTFGESDGHAIIFDVTTLRNTDSEILGKILKTNFQVELINLSGGGTFGLTTFFSLGSNGFIAGGLVKKTIESGLDWHEILRYVMPHSIEFIAFWLSGSMGFELAYHFIVALATGEIEKSVAPYFIIAFLLCTLFTIIAGICEVYLTLHLK